MLWDIFISHASEDKAEVARPLAELLSATGLRVWLDEQQLALGDSLSRKINDGLALSRFGVVVVSTTLLGKDYPQRELQALLARQTSGERYILPVLHKVDHSILLRRVPLLGDLLSVSTETGLAHVAAVIKRAVEGLPLALPRSPEIRYFETFPFPTELVADAVFSIRRLHEAVTWPYLSPRRDMSREDVWMGTDSPELIEILFGIYAPLAHFANNRYRLERTLTTLAAGDQVRFVLLDSALEALSRDLSLAAAPPRLAYTPRVRGWRRLRAEEPGRYWWQGLTSERFRDSVPSFYDSTEMSSSPSRQAFERAYSVGYQAFGGGQQTLGLLANPLYGFTPKTRPVYWRSLVLWLGLYEVLAQVAPDATRAQLQRMLLDSPWLEAALPAIHVPPSNLPESVEETRQAVASYCVAHVRPRLLEVLGVDGNGELDNPM